MKFTDGTTMLNHFLVKLAFLTPWKDILNADDVPAVFSSIEERLNAISKGQGELMLTIPYVCIDCRRQ